MSCKAYLVLVAVVVFSPPNHAAAPPAEKPFTPEEIAFFEKDVLPILRTNCLKCHGETKPKAKLRMTTRGNLLKGGDTGTPVNLAKPDDSLLLKALHYKDDLQMPPAGKLPDKEIAVLTRWVKAGLPWTPGTTVIEAPKIGGVVTEESKNYWAYRPVKRPAVPVIKDAEWGKKPVDAFLLARLEAKGLKPNGAAERIALIRRATYDLTGLPPTPEEMDEALSDKSQEWYEKLIDKLLASPRYGEKWGRHWLDLVRYAETNGYERDGAKPHAWRFRDYVIKSFNEDKPFDRFVKEQLAGDELDREDPDCVVATGYYRLGIWDDEPVDPLQARFDELDDWVATTGQVFLGMTMNCARCHDHKIDPIPQADYYRLLAFFQDVRRYGGRGMDANATITDITRGLRSSESERKERQDRINELTKLITAIEEHAIKKMPAEDQRKSEGAERSLVVQKVPDFLDEAKKVEYRTLRKMLELKQKPATGQELALSVNNCLTNPPQSHVLIRGNAHAQGAKVEPGFPQVLSVPDPKLSVPDKSARSSGRRLVLANWMASKENPLTARVFVNRLWQHHFGQGIVPSTNDFGKFGTPPTHPELLDWLASEFVEGGWKIKRMHKLLLLSNAYRMSSRGNEQALKIDPANQLYWRFPMRRLTAEEVRDSLLAVSGRLNSKMRGPSVYPPIPREVLAGQSRPGEGWPTSNAEESARRSIYVHVKRSLLVPILSVHDQADTDSSCPVRYTTTVPTQALGMLNSQFTNEQAAAFAERLQREHPGDLAAQVKRAVRLTTGRTPTEKEIKQDLEYVGDGKDANALRRYCLLLLNTNEFIYLD